MMKCHTNQPLISLVNEVIVNYYVARKQQEMVKSRRRRRDNTMSVVQVVFPSGGGAYPSTSCTRFALFKWYCNCATALLLSLSGSSDRLISLPAVFFLSLSMLSSAPLVAIFSSLSLLPLSVLISHRSPAHSILFALGQDKHCLCVTPKTFHRLSRFQHGPDISIIGFFLLWECLGEWEWKKKKRGEKKTSERRGGHRGVSFPFHKDPIKMSQRSPTTILSVTMYYVEQKDQHGDPHRTKIG